MAMTKMASTVPHQDSTHLLADPEGLRARANEEGYLFFEGLLPSAEVLEVRRQILEVCERHGFLDDHAPLEDGIARDGFFICESDVDPLWKAYYRDILKLRGFHTLALHSNILAMLQSLLDEPVLPHGSNILMTLFPRDVGTTTPVHQDFALVGGTEETWTTWIPCGDCPTELGELAILPRSHKSGLQPHGALDPESTGIEVPADSVWAVSGLQCGDVLLFKSTTAHQGVDNMSGDRIRLSVDFRYQPLSHPVRRTSMQPHREWLSWDEVYEGWPDDDPVKYYWKDWALNLVDV